MTDEDEVRQMEGCQGGGGRGDNRRDRQVGVGWVVGGVSEKKDTAVSQHTQWKAGGSVPCPQRDTRTVAVVVVYLERGGGDV